MWEEYFADAYHWPPEVTARLPPRFLDVSPVIREAKAKAAAMRDKSAGKGPRM